MVRDVSDIVRRLAREPSLVIAPYPWPDLDGLASSLLLADALTALGRVTVGLCLAETPQVDAEWAIGRFGLSVAAPDALPPGPLVVVDTSEVGEIPEPVRDRPVLANIDHHMFDASAPIEAKYVHREDCGACASLVVDAMDRLGLVPDPPVRVMAWCAIQLNSFRLQAEETAPVDRRAADLLALLDGTAPEAALADLLAFKRRRVEVDLVDSIDRDIPTLPYRITGGTAVIGQIEVPAARRLLDARRPTVEAAMAAQQARTGADLWACVFPCFDELSTFLVTDSPDRVLAALDARGLSPSIRDGVIRIDTVRTRKWLVRALQS